MATVEEVSLFLNLATSILAANGGSLRFLTGNTTYTIAAGAVRNEETQCLATAGKLWIANNYDSASTIQVEYLKRVGVSSKTGLIKHVDKYLRRVLNFFNDKARFADQNSPKLKLLHKYLGGGEFTRGDAMPVLPGNGTCNEHNVQPVDNAPNNNSLLMITGSYAGTNVATKCHAEQKLVAAFAKYVRANPGPYQITIGGNKSPCAACAEVLAAAAVRFQALAAPSTLNYTNALMDRLRTDPEVGLNPDAAGDIRKADLEAYFTGEE